MLAANIMGVVSALKEGSSLDDAMRAASRGAEVIPVVDMDGRLIGKVESRRLLTAFTDGAGGGLMETLEGLRERRVDELVERGFPSVGPDTKAEKIIGLLREKDGHEVFVVDDGMRLLGSITAKDLFKRLWEYREKIR